MLPFFRKIRYRLAEDNQFFKYSRYAIGEIVLVVVGILIALQINNWNEQHHLRRSQRLQLSKLRIDLAYDLEKMSELDSIYSDWEIEGNFIRDSVLYGFYEKLEDLSQHTIGRGSMLYYSQKRTTYDEMLSTGSFYSFENDDLSKDISDYYEYGDFELTKLNQDNQHLERYLFNFGSNNAIIIVRLIEKKNLEYVDWSWLQNPKSEMYKEMELRVNWTLYAIEANRKVILSLSNKARKLISIIDKELGRE